MTTREKRYALIDHARNQLDVAMRKLPEAIDTYKQTVETFKQYRMNGDYVCEQFYINGKFRTLESALDEMIEANNAVVFAEDQMYQYKHMSDDELNAVYMLMEVARII